MSAIRMLTPFEHAKYRDHLLRLGAEDRRLRFGAFADNAQIEAFADGIDRRQTRVLAQLDADLEVIAAVQISMLAGRAVEFAFSVDPAYRRRGVGAALMNRALLWARNRRRTHAYIHCLRENIAIRQLARHARMEITAEAGEMEAFIELPAATPLSVVAESLAEGMGFMDFTAKVNRLARARITAPVMSQASVPALG